MDVDMIAQMVEGATFFGTDDLMLRIETFDHELGSFRCVDEQTGEVYEIAYEDVSFEDGDLFYQLTPMIPETV